MKKLRVVFMGTPDFAVDCLERIIADNHEVVAVVTQPDRRRGRGQKVSYSPVKECALQHNIPILQPIRVKEAEFINELRQLMPDVIIVVAFGQILPKEILDLPRNGCINVHASLLPKYRGSAPIHWAIMNGEQETGITTMFMDIGMDTGDMILKRKINIGENENTGQLHDRLKVLGAEVLSDTMSLLASGAELPREVQNESEATYAPMLKREHERIDWTKSAIEVHNKIRGLNPWPGAYCISKNKILKIWQTRLCKNYDINMQPGTICEIRQDALVVKTGAGAVEIIEVQPECRKRMNAKDCACGYCLQVGDKLE